MKGNCIICGEEIEIQMCCNGTDCGCNGQPIEPPVCGDLCYDELINNMSKYYLRQVEQEVFAPDDLLW